MEIDFTDHYVIFLLDALLDDMSTFGCVIGLSLGSMHRPGLLHK
jgi:hypothetical protein